MKKTALNSEHESRKLAPAPAENAREENSRGGSIGSATRRSTAMNAPRRTSPPAKVPTTSALPQPASLARISPHTIPSAEPATSPRPGRSNLARGP